MMLGSRVVGQYSRLLPHDRREPPSPSGLPILGGVKKVLARGVGGD